MGTTQFRRCLVVIKKEPYKLFGFHSEVSNLTQSRNGLNLVPESTLENLDWSIHQGNLQCKIKIHILKCYKVQGT
jgi:hypothetical protein